MEERKDDETLRYQIVMREARRYIASKLPDRAAQLLAEMDITGIPISEGDGDVFGEVERYAATIATLTARAEAAEAREAKLREALTPSGDTKAAYSGEFYEEIELINPEYDEDDEDSEETLQVRRPVQWTTIKEIMHAIALRASGKGG
ncbi:hypothetical protein [Aureimonas glaciei]|uniref:Uncharacterized protein n=1 Tax=Aureimonas glaciei TaxID=1776957 RepID=A0A916XU49_9HYPH|nr:hypothetical protein [Aureimonas glaciei]GGD11849.1 hypothetical protein GCM10011335_13530 [Aureimonas glaciei]